MNTSIKVCTIGGGSGMPIINKGLINAGFRNIKSIVTTFDSGGDTGRMRTDERGQILAFSDYWRSLMSLWKDDEKKKVWEDMLKYRDGRGRNFGNVFFQFMSEKSGSLSDVDSLFSLLIDTKLSGEVIPVSNKPSNICFETISGKVYCNEHTLDDLRMSKDYVKKIWMEPQVDANTEAINALLNSDVIIICPGSMYGSVLANFLPNGIIDAYKRSKAKKILFTNIMSVVNENDNFTQSDYVNVFSNYIDSNSVFDLIIMPDLEELNIKILDKVLENYAFEYSSPILYNKQEKIKTIKSDIVIIDDENLRLRHSEKKLGLFFTNLEI